ncbi:serine protease persephone-like isoform X1 [Rhynchophorus ferrugineus]|uniref:serine protease persephone-like isoform X1 n=1 Tax=Rhynchophorus ferrugineus TaxID=354439 RepID=UPI003FCCCE84
MKQTMFVYQFLILLNLFNVLICSYIPIDEGSPCQDLGIPGICKKVLNCEDALGEVRTYGGHSYLRCGFVGLDEVVCCPVVGDRTPQIEISTWEPNRKWNHEHSKKLRLKRKNDLMCETYVKKHVIRPSLTISVGKHLPHMAALGFPGSSDPDIIDFQRCSGSLVSLRFVLTAAHCIISVEQILPVMVRLGVSDIRNIEEAQDINIKSSLPHPEYNARLKQNDIALLELVKDVTTNEHVYPACLYTFNDNPSKLIMSGWGHLQDYVDSNNSFIMQTAEAKSIPIDKCNERINSTPIRVLTSRVITDNQICAILKSDSCCRDSGSPLQIEKKDGSYHIVGITSWGIQRGTTLPLVYTRVSSYLDWIGKIIWPKDKYIYNT